MGRVSFFLLIISFFAYGDRVERHNTVTPDNPRQINGAALSSEDTFAKYQNNFNNPGTPLSWDEIQGEPIIARRVRCAIRSYLPDGRGGLRPSYASVFSRVAGVAWDPDEEGEQHLVSVLDNSIGNFGYTKVRPARVKKGAVRIVEDAIEQGQGIELEKREGSLLRFDCERGDITNQCTREVMAFPNGHIRLHQIDYYYAEGQNQPNQATEEFCE